LGLSPGTRDIIEHPFAHGRDGGGKESCREFDAAQSGTFHQTQPMVAGVFHFTHQIKIRAEAAMTRRFYLPRIAGRRWKSRDLEIAPRFPLSHRNRNKSSSSLCFSLKHFKPRQGDTM